jgi:hypothetical protein
MKDEVQDNKKRPKREIFKAGVVGGIGWAIGVTIGFAIISVIIIFLIDRSGGIPLIGDWIAEIVEATQTQLELRNPYYQDVSFPQ